MSTATVTRFSVGAPTVRRAEGSGNPAAGRLRVVRPATATGRGPIARPRVRGVHRRGQRPVGVAAPAVVRRPVAAVAEPLGWRLTDRGLAVVMGLGLVLVAIALAVVVSTAITVTDENYQPTGNHQVR